MNVNSAQLISLQSHTVSAAFNSFIDEFWQTMHSDIKSDILQSCLYNICSGSESWIDAQTPVRESVLRLAAPHSTRVHIMHNVHILRIFEIVAPMLAYYIQYASDSDLFTLENGEFIGN